jgi:hypothetical protein
MPSDFPYDVFLSHSAKDKAVVRELAERLRKDGITVWYDEWALKPGDNIPAKIEEGLESSRVLMLCMSANAFGSDWSQLEAATFRFRDPLNKQRRFLPVRLDDAPIKGSLAQFLYINWLPASREQEYPKLLEACCAQRQGASAKAKGTTVEAIRHVAGLVRARLKEWGRMQEDFETEARKYHDVKMSICIVTQTGPPAAEQCPVPNYSINLWQYFGSSGCDKTMERLRSMKLTQFGVSGAEITALGVLTGKETELFRKMALRAGTLLPDEISHIVAENAANSLQGELSSGKPILTSNSNPLAKWLNMMLIATSSSHPERIRNGRLDVDPFAGSLSIFDYLAIPFSTENSAADFVNQQSRPPSLRPIGDAWSGLRGVLQEAYSTKTIKGILGQAGLTISKIAHAGTYKGPFLDGADRLVSALDEDSRDRFVEACIQEVLSLERKNAGVIPPEGEPFRSETLERLQLVLGRFGHELKAFYHTS